MNKSVLKNTYPFLILFLIAFCFISLFSKCSPLYCFHNGPDLTVMFEVGKRMFAGKVLYRDVVDAKGPFLLSLYGIASLISSKTYIGVYFFEIIFSFITLVFTYKTAKLRLNSACSIILSFFVASVIYCCPLGVYGGDTAEIMLMPCFVYLYYLGFRYLHNGIEISDTNYLIIGITSGCVLFSKYSLLCIYLAWFIIPAYDMLKQKNYQKLIKTILIIALGVLISFIPWIIYFGANDYLTKFLKFYLFEQIKYYKDFNNINFNLKIRNTITTLIIALIPSFTVAVPLIIGKKGRSISHKNKRIIIYNSLIFIFDIIFIFVIGVGYKIHYHAIPLLIFTIPCGIYFISYIVKKQEKPKVTITLVAVILISLLYSFISSSTISTITVKEEDTPYYAISQYIKKSGVDNPIVYATSIDASPYIKYMDYFVDYKFFSVINASFPEMIDYYKNNISSGEFDFVISVSYELSKKYPYTEVFNVESSISGNKKQLIRLYESNKRLNINNS